MKNVLPLLVAAAVDGLHLHDDDPMRRPYVCFADDETAGDGYATVGEMGYFEPGTNRWIPADYSTMGRPGVGASPFALQQRGQPAPAAPARSPFQLSPGALRMPFAPRPAAPAAAPGITSTQVQQQISAALQQFTPQVQAMIQQMIAQMSPYGQVPARVAPDEALFPMGLGFVVLSGGPPSVISASFPPVLPQRAFRGERLVLSTFRSSGAATVPVIVDTFKVGDYSQLVGGGAVPVETFSPDSFGVRLMLDGAVPGVTYTLNVSVPPVVGIPAGETVTVVGAVIGRAGEAAQR